jgi:hypothetical protein
VLDHFYRVGKIEGSIIEGKLVDELHLFAGDFFIGEILGEEIAGCDDIGRTAPFLPDVIPQKLGHVSLACADIQDLFALEVSPRYEFKDPLVRGPVR